MESLKVDIEIARLTDVGVSRILKSVLVDPDVMMSWMPEDLLHSLGVERRTLWQFQRADGTVLERWSGGAILRVAGRATADEVVFAQPDDRIVLGARTLTGLNLRVDHATNSLEDAGPIPAATAAFRYRFDAGVEGIGDTRDITVDFDAAGNPVWLQERSTT